MTSRTRLPLAVLLVCLPVFGQLIPGIGFPGGRRYPQGGRGGQTSSRQPDNSASLKVGMLRKIDDNDVIVESDDDHSVITIATSGSTKYQNASGGAAKIGDFQPGDHVSVNTTQDSKKAYHAKTMNMVREGTAEEHATASAATGDTSRPIGKPADSESGGSPAPSTVSRNGAPTLRRAPGSSGDSGDSSDTSSSAPSRSSTPASDSDRPVLRRATPSNSNSDSNSASSAGTAPPTLARPSDNTPDPPRLRRASQADSGGAPAAIPDSQAVEVRPSLHADESNTIRRMPAPAPATEDPFIDQARDAAFAFSETLPNYIVKQYTTRYATVAARGNRTNWQALDNVTADVIQEGGVEKYKNILINGKPPVRDVEKSGSWSRGEFSSMMQDVLSPITNAEFHSKRSVTMVNRAAVRYDFSVEQPNSHWHIEVEGGVYMPGYTGTIWFDKENYRVLRIEMSAQGMPSTFALDQVEWAVDYDYVAIAEGRYLLPAHSETLSCARSNNQCTRNVIEFRNYKKFTAETSITFDTDK